MGFRLSRNEITNAMRAKRVKCACECVHVVIFFSFIYTFGWAAYLKIEWKAFLWNNLT